MTDARQTAIVATEAAIAAKNPPEPTQAPEPVPQDTEALAPEPVAQDAAAEPVEDDAEGDEHEESAPSDNGAETTAKPKKAKPGVQKRFSELTKEKHEALRAREEVAAEAAYWREQAFRNSQQAPQQQQQPSAPAVSGKPTLEQFGYDQDAYESARDQWVIEQAHQKWQATQQQQSQRQQQEQRVSKFRDRVAAFEKEVPGGWEAAKAAPFDPTPVMVEAIAESEIGPKLGYYLSQHLDEARTISGLAPFQQAIAMGRIEAKLQAAPSSTPRAPVTRASAPAPSLSAGGTPATPADRMSIEDHMARVLEKKRAQFR